MLISFSCPTTFYFSSVMKQWHITPYCETYDWNNAKMTTMCECSCKVPRKHSEIITYHKSCLGKQHFLSFPQSTTIGRRPVVVDDTHTLHTETAKAADGTQQPPLGYCPQRAFTSKEIILFRLLPFHACRFEVFCLPVHDTTTIQFHFYSLSWKEVFIIF